MALIESFLIGKIKHGIFDRVKNMGKAISYINKTDILVGIPQEAVRGHYSGLTNAELLYIQIHGSPANNIPPRNVFTAAFGDKGTKDQINDMLKTASKMAIRGDLDGCKRQYEKIGMVGAAKVQEQFGTIPPPNSPVTIARKGSSATLIDTGALRQSITYKVRTK